MPAGIRQAFSNVAHHSMEISIVIYTVLFWKSVG